MLKYNALSTVLNKIGITLIFTFTSGVPRHSPEIGWGAASSNSLRTTVVSQYFYNKSALPMKKILLIICHWSMETKMLSAAEQLGVNKDTINNWGIYLRETCGAWLTAHPRYLGGLDNNGQPKEVEIDESLCFRRKNNIGRHANNNIWVFGAIERETKHLLLQEVY